MENDLENTNVEPCPFCGEDNEKGNHSCAHCGNPRQRKGAAWFKNPYILYGTMALLLIGITGFFLVGGLGYRAVGGLGSRLVGRVNGEEIKREEYSQRMDRAKKLYEDRYGKNLFEGEAGKENLNRLKSDILNEIVIERILLQEAKTAGFTSAPPEEIDKQIEAIKKKHNFSDADFQKIFGGTLEDIKRELGKGWVISQFLEKAVVKGDQGNGDTLFQEWLSKAKAKARIEIYERLEPVATANASCCGPGGMGGGVKAQPLDPKIEQEARAKALEYYEKKTEKKGATARVTNFGCHIQVDILEEGKVVASLTYSEGKIQEI